MGLTLGYRHLDGEMNPGKDRVFVSGNCRLGWMKVLYELETGEQVQNKLEVQLNF